MADEPFHLRVDRDRFVPLASVAIGVAIGMAVVLGVSRVTGNYFVIVSPFYAFLPVLAVAYAAVVFGRCRNEYLAVGLAVVVASITYWGQFPAALADEIGPRALLSPRLVARYVALRMQHESMESTFGTGGAARTRPPSRPDPGMNWVFGFAEWGGLVMGSILLLLYRCRAAYCERCGGWMSRERLALLPKSGSKVREQFETGTLDQLKLFTTARGDRETTGVEFCECRLLSAKGGSPRPLSCLFHRVRRGRPAFVSGAAPRGDAALAGQAEFPKAGLVAAASAAR